MAYGSRSGKVTERDFTERYAEAFSQPAEIGRQIVMSAFGAGQRQSAAQEMMEDRTEFDRRISAEAAKEGTLLNRLAGYERTVSEIRGLMQNGLRNFIPAREKFRALQEFGSANQSGFDLVIAAGDRGGDVADGYAKIAANVKSGAYRDATVNIGGTDVTLGQLFNSDDDNPLGAFDLGKDVADAYLGSDRNWADAVGTFVDMSVSNGGPTRDPRRSYNVGLLHEAAEYVANKGNYEKMAKAFGAENVKTVCRDVLTRFGNTGGMKEVMEGLVDYAESRGGVQGLEAVRNFMSFSSSLAALHSDPMERVARKNLDPSERRWDLVASMAAMKTATVRGKKLDLGDEKMVAAMKSSLATMNRAKSDGIELFPEAVAAGKNPYEDLVLLTGAYMDNAEIPPDTFLSRYAKARSSVGSLVFAAPVTEEIPVVASGAKGYYSGDPSRASGRRLTSGAAGVLENAVAAAVVRETMPGWMGGKDVGYAVRNALLDTAKGGGYERLSASVGKAFTDAIPGHGGQVLARTVLAPFVIGRLKETENRPIEIHSVMEDVVLNGTGSEYLRGLPERDAKAAVDAAAGWFETNVSQPERFAALQSEIVDHLMDGRFNHPVSGNQAIQRANVVMQQAVSLWKKTGREKSLMSFVDSFLDRGVEYTPVFSGYVTDRKTGKTVEWKGEIDETTGFPQMSDAQAKQYKVVNKKFVRPDGQEAGDLIMPRNITGIRRMRTEPGFNAWAVRNEAARKTYEAQQKFNSDPKNYDED